jgi:hypothetical protein
MTFRDILLIPSIIRGVRIFFKFSWDPACAGFFYAIGARERGRAHLERYFVKHMGVMALWGFTSPPPTEIEKLMVALKPRV